MRNEMETNEEVWAAKPKKEKGPVAKFFSAVFWFAVSMAVARTFLETVIPLLN